MDKVDFNNQLSVIIFLIFFSNFFISEMLIRYTGGIINDYRLAIDGIDIRQPRPRVWIAQDKKIQTGLTKLRTNRFSVAEFLGYCKHSTPNFGINRPNEGELINRFKSFFSIKF